MEMESQKKGGLGDDGWKGKSSALLLGLWSHGCNLRGLILIKVLANKLLQERREGTHNRSSTTKPSLGCG
jgi:hypothetical protein